MEWLYNIHALSLPKRSAYTTHNALPPQYTYCAFDTLWKEKSLVDCVDSVIGLNITVPLQQDWSRVQSVIGPEHGEAAFFVTVDQGPVCQGTAGQRLSLSPCHPQPNEHDMTHQLIAEAPLWRGSSEGW